jgi:DNA-binding CsgD family transcriptional regulator/tetratricopeptide (TPR) repeat protein
MVRPAAAHSSTSPFLGRDRTMALLRAALDDARSGEGTLVLTIGEAGIGKTRAAERLATLAAEQGFRVLWGRCHDSGAPPYWPWIQILRTYAAEETAARSRAAATIDDLLSRLDGSMLVHEAGTAQHPDAARFRLFDAIDNVLRRAAQRQPLLLVLDDLHEADPSTLHLLSFIARGLARTAILVVAACRPQENAERSSPLAALGQTPMRTLPLSGLDDGAVEQLLIHALGESPSRALLRSVQDLTEGNPFFVLEIAHWLERAGADEQRAPSGLLAVPDSVKAHVARRLDHLSEATRTLLRTAAVLGRDVDHGLLSRLRVTEHDGSLAKALDEAAHWRILHERDAPGHYRFQHALIRQVLYEELAPGARARLHAHIARTLEAEYQAGAKGLVHELAYHFGQASYLLDPDTVVAYLRAAGERDLAVHAYDEAARHFERALACASGATRDDVTAALLYGLGRARAATSLRWNRQEAWEHLRQAAEVFLRTGDIERAVAAVTYPSIPPEAVVGVAAAIEGVRHAVSPNSRQDGWLLARQAAAQYFETGDYAAASRSFAKATTIARQCGDDALELRTMALQTSVDHFDLRWSDVLVKSELVVHLARKINDPHAETYARYRLAYALAYTGRATEARAEARRNLAGAERLRDHGLHEDALYITAALAQLRGDWGEAREAIERGLGIAPHHLGLLHLRILLEFELGETVLGRASLSLLSEASAHAGPYPLREAYRAVVTPQLGLLGAEIPPAESSSADRSPNPNTEAMLTMARALGAVLRGDAPEAKHALPLLAPNSGSILTPLLVTERVLGLLEHTLGRLDQAASRFEAALRFCRSAGYRPELAWTSHDYARCLLARDGKGDRARAGSMLEEALVISADLGMVVLHQRVGDVQRRYELMLRRRPDALSPSEVKVIRLLAQGKTNQEIASALFISQHTVAAHVAHILAKTGCKNRTEAATYATRRLLSDGEPHK